MTKSKMLTVVNTARPSFLLLTPICILLGVAVTRFQIVNIHYGIVAFVFLGALFAHISVNMFNEYFDFKSGLDFATTRTPFSGGSGALPNSPHSAKWVLIVAIASLLITVGVGIYLIFNIGFPLLPIGLLGVIIVVTYTRWLNRQPLLCLIAPGLAFGVLMVLGTQVSLTGSYTLTAFMLSLLPFFLINNLLLLNQYPDVSADFDHGRRTFPIVFGARLSNAVYGLFTVFAYSIIIYSINIGLISSFGYIVLIPALASMYALVGAVKYGFAIGKHPQYLAANVIAALSAPLLLAIIIFIN